MLVAFTENREDVAGMPTESLYALMQEIAQAHARNYANLHTITDVAKPHLLLLLCPSNLDVSKYLSEPA